jgi:hypothetical protein
VHTKNIERDFANLLWNISDEKFGDEPLTALFPSIGKLYNEELMVIGRALNRWGSKQDNIWWSQKNKLNSKTIQNIINYSKAERNKCPLSWITDNWDKNSNGKYRMNKSAFWRVIKNILTELGITDTKTANWTSYIIWTNLYKIAPAMGGNPSNKLMDSQFNGSSSILENEIKIFRPKRILFLTGYGWFKDFEPIGFTGTLVSNSLVEWYGNLSSTKVVVAKHPQGKLERNYVKQVMKYF